ncbi:MAG: hypothetical protein J5I50_02395 [Chitinophagaceae bacterium]|nr:hypothetical protein [Chitinophagaceae bacterium]
MILTDYYKGECLTTASSRYDVTMSTRSYEYLETLLINKRKFNVGGLSFNYVPLPASFKARPERKAEMAITKGNVNISSVFVPDVESHLIGFGDVNGTSDGLIFIFSSDYSTIEILVARGYANDLLTLFNEVKDGNLDDEIAILRSKAVDVLKERRLPI